MAFTNPMMGPVNPNAGFLAGLGDPTAALGPMGGGLALSRLAGMGGGDPTSVLANQILGMANQLATRQLTGELIQMLQKLMQNGQQNGQQNGADASGGGGGSSPSPSTDTNSSGGTNSAGQTNSSGGGGTVATGDHGKLIDEALQLAGVPVTPENQKAVNLIVEKESGWKTDAINKTDSNAQAGHASQGLMQTIPSTFKENAIPGHNTDINDPLSNLIAGIRYAVKRYGSLQNVPGVKAVAAGKAYVGY